MKRKRFLLWRPLFLAPMESAQGQLSGSGMITVTEVDLDSFSFFSPGGLVMSLTLENTSFRTRIPIFHWSGIYRNPLGLWNWLSVTGTQEDWNKSRSVLGPIQTQYYFPGNRSDYYVCRFGSLDLDAWDSGTFSIDEDYGWIEVWVWTGYGGSGSSGPSAYVYDSDGSFYYVDLAIDGYVISGPSLD